MSYSTLSSWGPISTPPAIRRLLIATIVISILAAAIQTIFDQLGINWGPQYLLSLSWYGLTHGYIWQPFTFLFINDSLPYGLSFFFFINLVFSSYLLWVLGTSLIELIGAKQFLAFYFITGIGSALITLLATATMGIYAPIVGNTTALLALITAWSMAYAESEILFFFLFPIRAKWLVAAIFGVLCLMAITHFDFASLVLYIVSILFGYVYAAMIWEWKTPFSTISFLDKPLYSLGNLIRSKLFGKSKGKIIDIESGKPLSSDEAFVDQMLAKISKYGEQSLTWLEKRRLEQISRKKDK